MELFWRLVDKVQPALYRVTGPSRPVPIVEDMAVSPEVLPDFLVRMQNVLKRNQVTASLYCHAGQGQLHVQPFLDLGQPGRRASGCGGWPTNCTRRCWPSRGASAASTPAG